MDLKMSDLPATHVCTLLNSAQFQLKYKFSGFEVGRVPVAIG